MRPLSSREKEIIKAFADRLSEEGRAKLIDDMNNSIVDSVRADGEVVHFSINGYERPPYHGQHSYPTEASVLDSDGEKISIVLFADENDHLLELEFIRWADGNIIAPQWNTLHFPF
ncbi:DUF6984 family protein [Nitrospirillum viridazoti]|uniref:DUF6984 family protein n=1 Tax=Nitrospirillum viridazoti TaxID=3144925 RepID=UPI00110F905A|nr:hypothetical protein [Nitrospirillum amazonense]